MLNDWPPNEPILKFISVSKKFGDKTILNNLSFEIYKGELFGLIGQSGAGKTTLLRTLIGYYTPDKGTIIYKGKDVTKNRHFIRKTFGFATQDSCFYEELNLPDNLEYFGTMNGIPRQEIKQKTEELLKLVDLWEHKNLKASQLSGGMQRRLDLAISLIQNPEFLILDEPTTGLDPLLRKHMWATIKRINHTGVTIIMSSHILEEMEILCNDVAMIKDGTILIKGSPDQLKNFYSKNHEVYLETYPSNYKKILDSLKEQGIPVYYPRHDGNKVVFYTPDPYLVLKILPGTLLKNREQIIDVRIEKPNLTEVFEALTNMR